jgi:hypothetical protein
MPRVCAQIYDEMVDELCDADGSDRLGEHNPALAHDVTLLSTLLLCALPLRRVLEANRKCRRSLLAHHQCCASRLRLRVARLTGSQARVRLPAHGERQGHRRHGDAQDHE